MTKDPIPLFNEVKDESPVHGAEGFTVSKDAESIPDEERISITREDLKFPEFDEGEALVALICNVKDVRKVDDGEIGALYPEQAAEFRESVKRLLTETYERLPQDEREKLDIVVVAGDTPLVTPGENGLRVDQQRAVLTGEQAIAAIREVMSEHDIDSDTHLVADGEKPVAISHLRDVNMLHQADKPNVKRFMDYMMSKYGTGRELWMAYEDDTEKELREELEVEGPDGVADRMSKLVNLCSYMADLCQQDDPSRRVIVLAVGHYDNISPWAKKNLMGINPADGFIPVEKAGGLVITRGTDGTATTTVGGKQYPLNIET